MIPTAALSETTALSPTTRPKKLGGVKYEIPNNSPPLIRKTTRSKSTPVAGNCVNVPREQLQFPPKDGQDRSAQGSAI